MDKPQTVICFAFNALGNDSLILVQGGDGVFKVLFFFSHTNKEHNSSASCLFTQMYGWC